VVLAASGTLEDEHARAESTDNETGRLENFTGSPLFHRAPRTWLDSK
jgi:hypothetical protein